MSDSVWASAFILTAFLALVVRGYGLRRVQIGKSVQMAAIWVAIILLLAAIFTQFPPRGG
jgi:hypothetical protein